MGAKRDSKYFGANYIYFVQRANGDIKIGYSNKFPNRISQLRGRHGDLSILGLVEGDEQDETELHEQFSDSRVYVPTLRSGGGVVPSDWFKPSGDLLAWITENAERYECPTGYHDGTTPREHVNGAHHHH